MCPPDRSRVGPLGIRRQIIDVSVSATRQNHRIGDMHARLARDQVARDNTPCLAIDHNQVQHLRARDHCHRSRMDLALKRLIRPKQKLLAGLSPRIERT